MIQNDLQILMDIRILLLHYWKEENNTVLKESLSVKLNLLDDLIIGQQRVIEKKQKLLGG